MKSIVTYAIGAALLSGLALTGASAQVRSIPVGQVSVNHDFRCDVRVGEINYFATGTSAGSAEATLQQAGLGGRGIVCGDQRFNSRDDDDALADRDESPSSGEGPTGPNSPTGNDGSGGNL